MGRGPYAVGIRGRLVLSLLLLVILSMWLLGLALMKLARSAATLQFSARARTVASAAEHALRTDMTFSPGTAPSEESLRRLKALLTSMAGDGDLESVFLYDSEGRELTGASSRLPEPPAAGTSVNAPENLEFSFPFPLGPAERGRIAVRFTHGSLQRHLSLSLLRIVVQLAITALVLVVFINILTTLTVLAPLRKLLAATERIGEGDLDRGVEAGGRDELGDLARSFNVMLERLRESEATNRRQLESLRQAHSDLKSKERELVQSEKMAAVGRVAAGVAHEVGNPLGSVTGYLAMLRDERLSEEEKRDYLERTQKELSRINRIMLDLLNYARPPRLEWSAIAVNSLLRDLRSLLSPQFELRKTPLSLELEEGLPPVRGDLHGLQQMLVNIVLNASQAMPDGGPITLKSFIRGGGKEVAVSVTDSGPGIKEEDVPYIFEPFFTSRSGQRGSGLGLALCRQIADSMGALLEVDSRPGKGATFTVVLPAAAEGEEEEPDDG